MKSLKSFFVLFLVINGCNSYAQIKVGNNESTIQPSSLLELESTTKGLLLPRMTTAQRDAISTTGGFSSLNSQGLIIYNTSTGCINWWNNTIYRWVSACSDSIGQDADFFTYTKNTNTRLNTTPTLISNDIWTEGTVVWGAQTNSASGSNVGVWGTNNTVSGNNSGSLGQSNTVSGPQSLVGGISNSCTGQNNVVFGNGNFISGNQSGIWGLSDTITTNAAAVWGLDNKVSGHRSSAWGQRVKVSSINSAGWGNNNQISGDQSACWGATNVVSGENAACWGASNTVAALNSTAFGNNNTVTSTHTNSIAFGSGASTFAVNSLAARFQGGYSLESNSGGTTGVILSAGSSSWSSISDKRAKENIKQLSYGLNEVLKINTYQYNYIGSQKQSLGVIAQEMYNLMPEIVDIPQNDSHYLSVKYTELIPVLINSIKELNNKIEAQQSQIVSLQNELNLKNSTSANVK